METSDGSDPIYSSSTIPKTQSHGRIGEAAVAAKCWMHGIRAYNTGGLRANFAGSDLIIDTADPTRKRLVQVKTGYVPKIGMVYLTQSKGNQDLMDDKFVSDFVVFVNIDKRTGSSHSHDGSLDFKHLTFYVVPRAEANELFRSSVQRQHAKPLRAGGTRSLSNMAVLIDEAEMAEYRDAWWRIRSVCNDA